MKSRPRWSAFRPSHDPILEGTGRIAGALMQHGQGGSGFPDQGIPAASRTAGCDTSATKANHTALRGRDRDGMMGKAARDRPLRASRHKGATLQR